MAKKKGVKKKSSKPKKGIDIKSYERKQKPPYAEICKKLRIEIDKGLPRATARIYHRIPVWFVGENAVVGFMVTVKNGVNLMFWNGQNLEEPGLKATGNFFAAQIQFRNVNDINVKDLHRRLKKAGKKIWDFAGLRKQK